MKNIKPDIQWQDIKDFRNKIAHDYIGIDLFIVFRIIQNELDPLKKKIVLLISEELENKNFDEKEFQLARESFYYRHIPFNEITN